MRIDEKKIEHKAFGQIRASRVSGRANLFMVDYPQQHFVTLTISAASLHRDLSNDWVFGGEHLIEVAMSEVQWAGMIASMNTQGVPCTLTDYYDPISKKFISPSMPDDHVAKPDTYVGEVKKAATNAAKGAQAALDALDDVLGGGPVKKGDLQTVREKLRAAVASLDDSLPWVVRQADEKIRESVVSANAEVNAHIDYAMTKLGERALGEKLQSAIEAGVDLKLIGSNVADAVAEKNKGR